MPFVNISSAVVAQPAGGSPVAYVIRDDLPNVAALDTKNTTPVGFAYAWWHPFTGQQQDRSSRKQLVRVNVYGQGVINTGVDMAYMIVAADESRRDIYAYSALSSNLPEGMIWQQNTLALQGRQFDVFLALTGIGIHITAVEIEYVAVT